ncbi:MAG: tetratricopeptide repeat protein [Planctomycetota bacterium]|nr:tetratricopeptide repeat protein [Planctomycetota bacterium]
MRRVLLFALAAALLLVAALLREPPARGEKTTLGAVGESMGGMRVVVIDGLFFRAEALRRRGRLEDAAGLYHAILELDPANEAATIFLADLFVDGMLPGAVEAEARFLWWREARGVLTDALARSPTSAPLHDRAASLITRLPLANPDLEPRLARELGNWRLAALRHLAIAVEQTGTLARRGRGHVVHASLLAPDVAARALRADDEATYTEALRLGRRLQVVRAGVLEQVLMEADRPESLGALLAASLDALEAVAAVPGQPDAPGAAEAAGAAVARVEGLQTNLLLTRLLREVLDGHR